MMEDYNGKFVEGGCVLNKEGLDIKSLFGINNEQEEGMNGIQGMC